MDKDKWIQLMKTFGFSENEQEFNMIFKSYSENHRKYHNSKHIIDCLAKCALNEKTKLNSELHLAFWYHDVICKPFKKDNELKSAELAENFLNRQLANNELIKRIKNLIMVTLHNQIPRNEDEAYMMDIDISILGSNSESYIEYTENIRKEYKWVPWFIYKRKRREVLEMFLNKDNLYYTEYFKGEFEQQARINIVNEITQLKNAT